MESISFSCAQYFLWRVRQRIVLCLRLFKVASDVNGVLPARGRALPFISFLPLSGLRSALWGNCVLRSIALGLVPRQSLPGAKTDSRITQVRGCRIRFSEGENDRARHRGKGYYMNMPESKTVKFKVSLPKVRSVASSRRIKDAVRTVKGSASSGKKK
jgi:hypothetical protein